MARHSRSGDRGLPKLFKPSAEHPTTDHRKSTEKFLPLPLTKFPHALESSLLFLVKLSYASTPRHSPAHHQIP
jgi:hypothetical protein